MNQLKNEIGYCRCWVRQSLNDCLLSSYISNMRKNATSLKPYYRNYAFVLDPDTMELAESLVGGIEACVSFQLPLNSSLLNYWPDLPLQLSGLYTPNIQSCPIASGIDVANACLSTNQIKLIAPMTNDDPLMAEEKVETIFIDQSISIPKPLQTNELFSDSIQNSPFKESMMSRKNLFVRPYNEIEEVEDVANVDLGIECSSIDDDVEQDVKLTALLSRVDAMNASQEAKKATAKKQQENQPEKFKQIDDEVASTATTTAIEASNDSDAQEPTVMGNSLTSGLGWSSPDEQDVENIPQLQQQMSTKSLSRSSSLTIRSPIDRYSYNSLLRRGNTNRDGIYARQIDFNEVWQRFENSLGLNNSGIEIVAKDDEQMTADEKIVDSDNQENRDDLLEDFEFVQAENFTTKFTIDELHEMVRQTFKIAREQGLNAQNFACVSCENPLGVGGMTQTTAQ